MADHAGKNVDQLVAELSHENHVTRHEACAALVEHGSAAVSALTRVLAAPQPVVRWEAAKALAEIADPAAAEMLVSALADGDPDVRWVAGEALIALRRDAIQPLLKALTKSDVPAEIYPGARHVVHDLAQRGDLATLLEPVVRAFDKPEPALTVPVAAERVLESFSV
jgi:HEAT repeat protein